MLFYRLFQVKKTEVTANHGMLVTINLLLSINILFVVI